MGLARKDGLATEIHLDTKGGLTTKDELLRRGRSAAAPALYGTCCILQGWAGQLISSVIWVFIEKPSYPEHRSAGLVRSVVTAGTEPQRLCWAGCQHAARML